MQHSNERIAPAVIRALELFRERIRPYQLAWNDTGEGQAEPLDDASWERTRRRTLEPGPNTGAIIQMWDDPSGVGELHVDYRGLSVVPLPYPFRKDDVSVLYLRLPTKYLEERGPNQVRALALEVAAELPFNSGYVDFVLSCGGDVDEALKLIQPRYPGVHFSWSAANLSMNTWVDGVHWMNFLGQPVLGKLGGMAGLREHLSLPGISLQEMSGDRVLITLGDRPEVGDVEAGQTLPLHRTLARLLEPHLYHWKPPFGGPPSEALALWERRFLD
ncbi:type VI immunity family protein [Vitiosangium sp. GDMCC 1.1324]|uniref:type VI immunity family protein n=1 Tax=Vitiosangium sp. (strain GDMCC 1.1324) TaxID=2138576 RepID=UPI003511E26F